VPTIKKLSPRQQKIVKYLQKNGSITNAICQELIGVARNAAAKELQKMVENGILQRSGKTRGLTFILA
jgi:predicted HTH transcriptional regulator